MDKTTRTPLKAATNLRHPMVLQVGGGDPRLFGDTPLLINMPFRLMHYAYLIMSARHHDQFQKLYQSFRDRWLEDAHALLRFLTLDLGIEKDSETYDLIELVKLAIELQVESDDGHRPPIPGLMDAIWIDALMRCQHYVDIHGRW